MNFGVRLIFNRTALIIKIFLFSFLAVIASGCTALNSYYPQSDAPERIKQGKTDFRLALTQVLGEPLAPLVRNVRVPYGSLRFAEGLEEHLSQSLKPLDIILVRSRPALTRLAIPSHFTHALIWLGTQSQRDAFGVSKLPEVQAHSEALEAGKIVYESAGSSVRLSDIKALTNTNEMVILRPARLSKKRYQQRYKDILQHLGVGFDTSFNLLDESKLTCVEIIALVFPEFNLPARYSTGRIALIPDDLARLAASANKTISLEQYIVPAEGRKFDVLNTKDLNAVLTKPKRRTAQISPE